MRGDKILLGHGSGGKLSHDLVRSIFLRSFDNPVLAREDDSAVLTGVSGRLAFTTDSYVINPIFFPGGDIGKLAVCGTVNDLAMAGAEPRYLSASFILEEGLALTDLERIVASMAQAAREADVAIVAGDTKVVERGAVDEVFINTAGLGIIPSGVEICGAGAHPGDVVLVSGTTGDHGMTIMGQRKGLRFSAALESDCAPLNGMVAEMLRASRQIHVLRDPTRGGLATVLKEIAVQSGVSIEIEEELVPVSAPVRSACEMLGLDPLYVANEGKLVAVVAPEDAGGVLAVMRAHRYGASAARIGEVNDSAPGRLSLKTALGARRVLDMLAGEQLPRIC